MKRARSNAKDIALCAMITALSVLILFLGSLIDVLDLTAAMLASILCAIVLTELGKFWPWLTYGAAAILALVLLPNKLPAIIFALTGYYPIVKSKIDRLNRVLAWTLKIALFNALLTVFLFVILSFFPSADILLMPMLSKELNILITYAAGNLVFVLYDIALRRLTIYYVFVLRDRLKIRR